MNSNENKIYGLLGLCMKAGKICFGTESCIDMLNKRKIKLLILAKDSSERTIENFQRICEFNNVPLYIFSSKDELSKSIGKNNKTVFGIRDKNLADAIKKILDGGDVIG